MKRLINKFRSLNYKEKTLFITMFSIIFNSGLALSKVVLSIVLLDVFFLVSGILNVLLMISKLECYAGIKYPHKHSFKHRNMMIGLFLLLSGIQYALYMSRLIYLDIEVMQYDMFLGISIATISFIELGISVKGCFDTYGKGHYFRNLKLIDLCSALTAIVLTEVAIMSFASEEESKMMDGIFGVCVGGIIVLIAIFIFIAPYFSLIDKEHNIYKAINDKNIINDEVIEIKLTSSKFYRNFVYIGKKQDNIIDGHIIQEKSPIWKMNIYVKIIVIILSEILIFPYAFGALIFYFKGPKSIKKLDGIMLEKNYLKIKEESEE